MTSNELQSVLSYFETRDTCFEPDFLKHKDEIDKTCHVYTHIAGFNDNVDIFGEPKAYYSDDVVYQPWFELSMKRTDLPDVVRSTVNEQIYQFIQEYLNEDDKGLKAFEKLIFNLNKIKSSFKSSYVLEGLQKYYKNQVAINREQETIDTFIFIAKLIQDAKYIMPKNIAKLSIRKSQSVTLSQHQCAVFLASMFLCINPFPINFHTILCENEVKVTFLMNYFNTIKSKMPEGNVSFRRSVREAKSKEYYFAATDKLSDFYTSTTMLIEHAPGCSQMDFANKRIGGGVLRRGAVQEEIRFLMCPEMIVSMILNECMDPEEAIFIVGAQTYSSFSGYAKTLQWKKLDEIDEIGNRYRDKYNRIKYELVAVDAVRYIGLPKLLQFEEFYQVRDLNKLAVGFDGNEGVPIVGGWWGCGAYAGDKQLKALLQLSVASINKRPLIFCTFGEDELDEKLNKTVELLKKHNVTAGMLLTMLHKLEDVYRLKECDSDIAIRKKMEKKQKRIEVFDYISKCLATSK